MFNDSMKVSISDYIEVKTKLLSGYNLLLDFDEEHRTRFLNSMGVLKNVAINTFLFPYDLDLYTDMKNISQDKLLESGLQEKYNISDNMILSKFQEYHGFKFGELVDAGKLDLELLNRFHYTNNVNDSSVKY